jgi:hypothetical protein
MWVGLKHQPHLILLPRTSMHACESSARGQDPSLRGNPHLHCQHALALSLLRWGFEEWGAKSHCDRATHPPPTQQCVRRQLADGSQPLCIHFSHRGQPCARDEKVVMGWWRGWNGTDKGGVRGWKITCPIKNWLITLAVANGLAPCLPCLVPSATPPSRSQASSKPSHISF